MSFKDIRYRTLIKKYSAKTFGDKFFLTIKNELKENKNNSI